MRSTTNLLLIIFLFCANSAYGATITITLPDEVVKNRIIYTCEKGRIECEGKSDSQIVMEAIDTILSKTGFGAWALKVLTGQVDVVVSYDSYDVSCKDCHLLESKNIYACEVNKCSDDN